MKRILVVILVLVLATVAIGGEANLPFNHNATLIPANASVASGGFSGDLNQIMLEYTQGLKRTNVHGKLAFQPTEFLFEVLLNHKLFDWNNIDMGFSYGAMIHQDTRDIRELCPTIIWNMSHKFTDDVDFYGGTKARVNLELDYTWDGNNWGYNDFAIDIDWNLYLGTQIDIAKNLELYIELQPALLNAVSTSYIGVNYYIRQGIKVTE